MTLNLAVIAFALAIAAAAAYVAIEYRRFRGYRVVTCPETTMPAVVKVDAALAAFALMRRAPGRQLQSCTRWPDREHCGQECLCQITQSPQGCRVTDALDRWYEGRTCVLCAADLSPAVAPHRPALLDPRTRITIGWTDIPTGGYPAILESHLPVCSNCHVTETFRRLYPGLVIDRPAPRTTHRPAAQARVH